MAVRGGREADRRARGEATRRQIIDTARYLFAQGGFFDTSVADIVARSGVGTRGAFYHHFEDKTQLFRVVFEEVEQDLVLRAIASPPEGEPWARLVRGLHRFLDAALEPDVQQIVLVDAPAVLGWQKRRSIEEANSIAAIEAVLRGAMDDGTIVELPSAELAHVVSAVVEEAALLVAHADDVDAARRAAGRILDRLLAGLLPASWPSAVADDA